MSVVNKVSKKRESAIGRDIYEIGEQELRYQMEKEDGDIK